ncbi:MAG: EAL domain-containing protein [Methylococcaceae bacterium]|jgi:diguanylate cyclase (GGDEF)-like protein/PAS domain S-box-containing protein
MRAWFYDLWPDPVGFMPHGSCYLWLPSILWLHVLSDSIIAIAYYSIPFALWYFVKKRTDLAYSWVLVLFGIFIILCGSTHLMAIWTIWHPNYWLEGVLKLATSVISIITAILVWPLIPKLLQLPSPEALRASEAYMHAIFDATPDTMLICNEQGIIHMVNQEAERLLGYKADELIGRSIETLVPEGIRQAHPEFRKQFADLPRKSEIRLGRPLEALRKDGSRIDVSINLSLIKTEKGRYFASSLRDVTQEKQAQAALQASEERFRLMANASPAMIWITDIAGNPTFVNQTWLNFTGMLGMQEISYKAWENVVHPDDRAHFFAGHSKNISIGNPIITEYRMQRTTGDWRWILDHGVPLYDKNANLSGYIGSAIDITERKLAETEFRIAATAFESQEAMAITDANTVILRVNKTFCDCTGYSPEEVVGKPLNGLNSGRHDESFYAAMWHSINTTGVWQGEIWDRRKNGEIYPKWLTITAVKDSHALVTHYVATHIDISDRKAAEDEIKLLAFYDPLTKLPNRRLLRDRLQQTLMSTIRNGVRGALMFIDLDNFKTLNDTLGHDMGDMLLQNVASRLSSCVRESDTVARFGGDEFVVLLDNLNYEATEAAMQTEAVSEKILAALNQPYILSGHVHHSSPSIGVTLFGDSQDSVDLLLKQSDIAMYQAKAAGRNTLRFFNTTMQAAVTARANLEKDLFRGYIEKQLELFYQIQVDIEDRITGVEALIRWRHPRLGLMTPTEFIPLAEETGLILPLGMWVLESVCEQLAKWAEQPEMSQLTIAVNVSVRQFRQADFVDKVSSAIMRFGVNPERLKLELTESLLVSDTEDIIAKMTALKLKGLAFSLDDFGTGYSSLYHLKRLPLDQLKIDRSFVRDILVDANDVAIAKMIIALANSMGLEVLAEGVEKQAQRDLLAELGCHYFQGYHFGRPVPIQQFEALFKAPY